MKKIKNFIFGRVLYTLLFVVMQLGVLIFVLRFFHDRFAFFYALGVVLSICTGLHVLNRDMNPAYKIAWLVPIMLFPLFGGLMYLMFGKARMPKRERLLMTEADVRYKEAMRLYPGDAAALAKESPDAVMHTKYITAITGVPPYRRTETRYLSSGEEYFSVMKAELEKAERFIFLEYFIIEEGTMWNEIREILERKARAGVDVRLIYDDLGCVFTLPRLYDRSLERTGIKTCVFHPFNSVLNARFNARDHRKICIIDGNVGLTGGVNLADEYINGYPRFGHWKDSGILLRGEAVWSLTVMFLSLWDYVRRAHDEFSDFAPSPAALPAADDGFIQPYTDTPFDDEPVGETVYLNLINRARRFVYITTPYLIIGNEMLTALRTASRSGVDVRIIVPGIPDKKLVYTLTKSYYPLLLAAGVRIFEYTPGFIHAKSFISDDDYGIVGTINLDYRSLYLHYECAAWMYRSGAVAQIKQDFNATLERCTEITAASLKRKNIFQQIFLAVLRAFAPML